MMTTRRRAQRPVHPRLVALPFSHHARRFSWTSLFWAAAIFRTSTLSVPTPSRQASSLDLRGARVATAPTVRAACGLRHLDLDAVLKGVRTPPCPARHTLPFPLRHLAQGTPKTRCQSERRSTPPPRWGAHAVHGPAAYALGVAAAPRPTPASARWTWPASASAPHTAHAPYVDPRPGQRLATAGRSINSLPALGPATPAVENCMARRWRDGCPCCAHQADWVARITATKVVGDLTRSKSQDWQAQPAENSTLRLAHQFAARPVDGRRTLGHAAPSTSSQLNAIERKSRAATAPALAAASPADAAQAAVWRHAHTPALQVRRERATWPHGRVHPAAPAAMALEPTAPASSPVNGELRETRRRRTGACAAVMPVRPALRSAARMAGACPPLPVRADLIWLSMPGVTRRAAKLHPLSDLMAAPPGTPPSWQPRCRQPPSGSARPIALQGRVEQCHAATAANTARGGSVVPSLATCWHPAGRHRSS